MYSSAYSRGTMTSLEDGNSYHRSPHLEKNFPLCRRVKSFRSWFWGTVHTLDSCFKEYILLPFSPPQTLRRTMTLGL